MTDALSLFGTTEPPGEARSFRRGQLSFCLMEGGLSDIRFAGTELIRAITFPVRDADWGTLTPVIEGETIVESAAALTIEWQAIYHGNGPVLRAAMSVQATPSSLVFRGVAVPDADFETNRAGFTVLHPVQVSGLPVRVEHTDGRVEDSAFPARIDPKQPFMDIRSLTHNQNGLTVRCAFEGDTFEMEDQRNWSDASFKTYVRPLALPWPYVLPAGQGIEQAVALSFSGTPEGQGETALAVELGDISLKKLPELSLVLTAAEARQALHEPGPLQHLAPNRIWAHLDPGAAEGPVEDDLAAFAALQAATGLVVDLEYAARCDGDLDAEFGGLARQINAAGLNLASILVCPSVDRQSTPPGSTWPACPPLEEVHAAVARAFPWIERGGGMLSYFTELNRKRPPVAALDYVTCGTNPIVHAADDRSVMQTLTALPWILQSAEAIVEGRPLRLGLSSIPMRQNPYGSRTMPNPEGKRLCMAETDPRHFAAFGAAFALGYLAAIAPFGVASWTPSALFGPRGLMAGKRSTPLADLLVRLAQLAGQPLRHCQTSDPERVAALALADNIWLANLTAEAISLEVGGTTVSLAPFAIVERDLA
ncbi:MAG: hypothetical protein P8N72_16165 [Flavimaricola sp.]|nr:hypothetical protein [Flavimaricola sp.]